MTTEEESSESLAETPDIALTGYVYAGRLCLLGMAKTPFGPIPLATRVRIGSELSDGPVDFENIPEQAISIVEKAYGDVIDKLQFETMKAAAENLVERARSRDQNAMAMIAMIREEAEKGSQRAKTSVDLLKEYIAKHPAEEGPRFSGEKPATGLVKRVKQASEEENPYAYALSIATYLPNASHDIVTIVMLANGPPLLKAKIFDIASSFGSEGEAKLFLAGTDPKVRTPIHLPNQARRVFNAGRCVGVARAIQGIRYPNVPLGTLSKRIAWELGE